MRCNSLWPVCSFYLPLCHLYQSPMALSLSFTEDQTSHRPPEGLGTGSSHLAVAIIFYRTIIFMYLQPARSSSKYHGLYHSHSTLKPHYLYSEKQGCERRLENTGNETPSWFREDVNCVLHLRGLLLADGHFVPSHVCLYKAIASSKDRSPQDADRLKPQKCFVLSKHPSRELQDSSFCLKKMPCFLQQCHQLSFLRKPILHLSKTLSTCS